MSKKVTTARNGSKDAKDGAAPRRKGNQAILDLAAVVQQHRQVSTPSVTSPPVSGS